MRRVGLIGLALALVVSVLVFSGSLASAGGTGPTDRREREELAGVGTIAWGPCEPGSTLEARGAECGSLSVPLDWDQPQGDKIQLAVSRVRHTVPEDQYQGIMLVNPGGPGGSGLIYSVLGGFVPNEAGAAYDWIGFDPRGVGASVPALRCDPDYAAGPRPPYDPVTPEIEATWLALASGYAADCAAAGGPLLDNLKTIDTVKDMNAIRHALGQEQLNFYGFSYGTYLGQVYVTRYPNRVRRMVLDSNVDPGTVWYESNLEQNRAFEVVIQRFFDWVARYDDVYGLGSTNDEVEQGYYTARSELAASPRGQLGSAEWTDAFLVAGYLQAAWPDVAAAFAAFVNSDDPAPATELYLGFTDVTDDNGYAMYLATECTDARWPRRFSTWRRDNTRAARDAPYITWANAWFNAPCLDWPAQPGRPVRVRGHRAPPILLLSETLDGATPYAATLEVRRLFPRASLIATEGGTTHANSLLGGNACVDDQVAAYLIDGTLPPRVGGRGADAACPAGPEPEPTPVTATASRSSSTAGDLRLALGGAILANR